MRTEKILRIVAYVEVVLGSIASFVLGIVNFSKVFSSDFKGDYNTWEIIVVPVIIVFVGILASMVAALPWIAVAECLERIKKIEAAVCMNDGEKTPDRVERQPDEDVDWATREAKSAAAREAALLREEQRKSVQND